MQTNTIVWRKSGLLIDSVQSAKCKQVIDQVDRALSEHHQFTDHELDFIVNYDIKYRMGREAANEDGD